MNIQYFRMISISVSAICLLICLLIGGMYFLKMKISTKENSIFSALIVVNSISLVAELIFYLTSWQSRASFVDYFEKMFFAATGIWLFLYTLYILVVTSKNQTVFSDKLSLQKKKNIVIVVILFIFLLIFLSPVENIYKDGYLVSSAGLSTMFMFFISFGLIIVDIILVLGSIKRVKANKIASLLLFIFLIILEFVANIFGLKLLLITFPMTFASFLMYHTIENPDVKMIEQLELAKDSADKANAAKTDFLSSMSHEIRTPLNAIVGFSDCIKHSDNLDEAKENADDIINASNTLLEIVNGILDISKIEAGKLEIINSNYNAKNLFSGLAKLMTPKMNEKGLDFQVNIAPDLPDVLYGDSANVKKVVTNLLSNAYKYTDSGFVKYDVKCVNANGVCRLIVTVTDSGRGIKKESIDKLFTKFQRVDEDRNTTIEGTGLGLAITKQLIELMGGTVVVDSVFGEGSKFTITLDQRIENTPIVEEKVSYDTIDLTGKKILVVDDNSINLKVAKKLLERYNATVEVCDSGFKCVELIDGGALFDLILMDDMMPKMSGTQTLKKLKEKETFNIPVFALTANAITGMKERYLEAGFNSYLAKPIEKEVMINEFNKLFNSKKTVEEPVVVSVEEQIVTEVVEEVVPAADTGSEEVKVDDSANVKNIEYLKSNNIDVDHGLELLGDMELYNDTMNDFIDEVLKRLPLLDEYKNNSDMPNYAILVHAIKSDCKYLGIMPLADMNYEHELKSKANDVDFVNSNYDALIVEINKYLDICKKYMGRD